MENIFDIKTLNIMQIELYFETCGRKKYGDNCSNPDCPSNKPIHS